MAALSQIVVTAAHGGVSPGSVPVGGGAAVVQQLLRVWGATQHTELTLLGLGEDFAAPGVRYQQVPIPWPPGRGPRDLVRLNELQYGRLCRHFERAVTAWILAQRRPGLVVLANDLSEGPDFAALAAAGVPVVTLWHVDVVDYFARFYLGGLDPARLTRLHRRLPAVDRLLPELLRLVFSKQAAALATGRRQIVPSAAMREVITRCYPAAARRVEVVPWGAWEHPTEPAAVASAAAQLRQQYDLRDGEVRLLTLSRLSPEKGLERLLAALACGAARAELPPNVRLLIAGEAAFMQGQRYVARLRRQAAALPCRVDFVGYAAGPQKAALWQLADLYVFPSRHESYGLTLAEALRAGLPVVSTAPVAAGLIPPGGGLAVAADPARGVPRRLWAALAPLLSAPQRLPAMAARAQAAGARLDFGLAAQRVYDICRQAAEE
ncbi:MAG: glycosyltransferase family 4 protein [Fimbriimonadaceae bacterium]|nr:glycosyltransferase family 4 protein [Fimbriimonadaceae bacterium]